jgi:hypothetical protein
MTKRPFSGSGYLNLNFRAPDFNTKRFVRVSYGYTPIWRYFDEELGKEVKGEPGLDVALHRHRRHWAQDDEAGDAAASGPVCISLDALLVRGFISIGVYKGLYEAIDKLAREEDRDRRKAAGAPPPSDQY